MKELLDFMLFTLMIRQRQTIFDSIKMLIQSIFVIHTYVYEDKNH